MKFLSAAAIAAATISILPVTAMPITNKTLNAFALGTVSNTTSTNTSMIKNPSKHHNAANRRDMDTESFPGEDWDNNGVSFLLHRGNHRVEVYNIDWAGEDGWMLYEELYASKCPFSRWSYNWTGRDHVKYEAKFKIGSWESNVVCMTEAIKSALGVDEVHGDQTWGSDVVVNDGSS